jgi:hypothetical protein
MPRIRNTDTAEEVARQRLGLVAETLSNIHYLIEHSAEDPESVKSLLVMAEPSMETLRELALQRGASLAIHPAESPNHPPVAPAADRADPLPLAAAGEENPTSGAEAPSETRVDRLEAD